MGEKSLKLADTLWSSRLALRHVVIAALVMAAVGRRLLRDYLRCTDADQARIICVARFIVILALDGQICKCRRFDDALSWRVFLKKMRRKMGCLFKELAR